jgi:hypothetical protein
MRTRVRNLVEVCAGGRGDVNGLRGMDLATNLPCELRRNRDSCPRIHSLGPRPTAPAVTAARSFVAAGDIRGRAAPRRARAAITSFGALLLYTHQHIWKAIICFVYKFINTFWTHLLVSRIVPNVLVFQMESL